MRGTPNAQSARRLHECHIGGAGDAAIVTVAADPDQTWVLDWMSACYVLSGGIADAAETLSVTIGGVLKWEVDIVQDSGIYGGPSVWEFYFPRGLYEGKNEALVVTLSAIPTVTARLNIGYH